ncbi:hypothetical protein PN502_19040, partial [Microcystis aeruginosa CS-338/01]|nr:hypothetical protein [Microcystis aeruginosa CS-338/01]
YQLSVISYQLSVISYQLSVISYQESGDCFYLFSYLPHKEAKLTLTKRLYEQGYQREDILRIENGFLEETRFLDRLVK